MERINYIDFDGVILDTEIPLFEEWRKRPDHHERSEEEKIKYIQKADWEYILNNSEVINDAIYHLKNMDPSKSAILTKIHSSNEGRQKKIWISSKQIKQPVILVPYYKKKTDVVDARGNRLCDDCLKNLREWVDAGGEPIFFDKDNDGYDSWHQPNVDNYTKIYKLSYFKKTV